MPKTKDEKFQDIIWNTYSQNNNYDKLKHQLNRVRGLMIKHRSFNAMSAKEQFDQSVTICIIANQSTRKTVSGISIIEEKKEQKFEYAVEEDYKEPKRIELK